MGHWIVGCGIHVCRTAKQLADNLLHVVTLFSCAGSHVHTILRDMEFNELKLLLPKFMINNSAAQENVTEVECQIWVLKK